jgi:hypothetical protein
MLKRAADDAQSQVQDELRAVEDADDAEPGSTPPPPRPPDG